MATNDATAGIAGKLVCWEDVLPAFAMVNNELVLGKVQVFDSSDPLDVSFFGAIGVMFKANDVSDLVEEFFLGGACIVDVSRENSIQVLYNTYELLSVFLKIHVSFHLTPPK